MFRRSEVRDRPGHGRHWLRIAAGCAVMVLAAATATVAEFERQVDQLTSALGAHAAISFKRSVLAPTSFGGPQTLLLIGNDQRAHTTTNPVLPHSNEMLLVRFDPSKPWISMLSVPRELEVPIHTPDDGIVITRLNAALFYGGIPLVVQTIKQVTGLGVNHVVVIDFQDFVKAVNAMGCVYSTIDRRYFHVNLPGGPQYTQVDLQPGYQRLCGRAALQFVTYRHTDTSLERDARDQDFLLSVKQQYGPTLIDNVGKFERIFGSLVQTDPSLHTHAGVSDLLGTLIDSVDLPARQVQFQVNLDAETGCACVTASPAEIRASVGSFLYGVDSTPSVRGDAALGRRAAVAIRPSATAADNAGADATVPSRIPLSPSPGLLSSAARRLTPRLPFPIEVPHVQVDNGEGFPASYRLYQIHGPGGGGHAAYVIVFSVGLIGQYYDVQGTSWLGAPVFDDPAQSVRVRGRTYYLYYSGHTLDQVAWFADDAGYWVRNTLTRGLSNAQMLAIAEHTTPPRGTVNPVTRRAAGRATAAPVTVVRAGSDAPSTPMVIGGVLALLVVPLGLSLLLRQRRRTAAAELALAELTSRLSRLEAGVAAAPGRREPAGAPRRVS